MVNVIATEIENNLKNYGGQQMIQLFEIKKNIKKLKREDAELVEKYSDSFDSHKYANAYIVTKSGTLLNSTVQEKVKDFKVGDYTKEGISYSNDNYVYFVKRVELPEKAYADEKYEDVFSSFEDNMKSEKYNDICKEYVDKVVVNEKIVSKYSFINAFLSDFVDTRKSNTNTTTSN